MSMDGDDQDDDRIGSRPHRLWHAYVDAANFDDLVMVDPEVLDRIWRQTDDRLSVVILRALECYAERLEEQASAWVPGSVATEAPVRAVPAVAIDPVSPEDVRRVLGAVRWGAGDFRAAIEAAKKLSGGEPKGG
jgi:hypothetical protein